MLRYFVLFLIASCILAQEINDDIVCEGRSFAAACLNGGSLRISAAAYGKTDAGPCGGPRSGWSANCGIDVTEAVRQTCGGKIACTVPVQGSDPCQGSSKYLEVVWSCDQASVQNINNNRGKTILFSTSSTRSKPIPLHGATVSDEIYGFLSPEDNILSVRFYVDDPSVVFETESTVPYELRGGRPFRTTQYPNGQHRVIASITHSDGQVGTVDAIFTVNNQPLRANLIGSETSTFEQQDSSSTPQEDSPLVKALPWALFGIACLVIVALVVLIFVKVNPSPHRI